MKSNRLVFHRLFIFIIVTLASLAPASSSYAQENDQGWSEPVNLSQSGAANNPVMVIDSRGRIHVIWLDDVDGYQYSQSWDDGKTWSAPQTVNFPFGPNDPPPVLLPGSNGSIHVFWLERDEYSNDQEFVNQRLLYAQATPGDLAYPFDWILNYPLSDAVMSFDVVIDTNGALHVALIQGKLVDDNPSGVYYIQSPSAGGYWIEPRLLYQSGYFRSAKQEDLYVRINSSNTRSGQKIFVTWDNRAINRVFLAVSRDDTGLDWNDAQQIKGPEDGLDTPFNLTVASYGRKLLLIWQQGEPGTEQCTIYSQWSEDSGENWKESVAVLGGRSECPVSVKVVGRNSNFISIMLIGRVNSLLVAWNGIQWSDVQSQTRLPSFANPGSFDAVLLGCRFDLLYKGRLYVVGCDQGGGGDVWFLSRALEPEDTWFSPSVVWGEADVLSLRSEGPERVSNFYTTSDNTGNINAVWVQSSIGLGKESNMTIEYARWDGQVWTTPESVISSLRGIPIHLLVTADPLNRLLLTWIDGYNGDLVFSRANLERANLASEWTEVTGLPTPSRLVSSSDVIVDGSGRIINVYVIPINEERGVYMVQSNDSGRNWSSPVRVFDAVSEGWERVEQPRVTLGAGGILHLVFIRSTVRVGQSVGLYYSRSVDGGKTWSNAQILSEGEIQWADIASYGNGTVHVAWQEYDGLVYANISQVSLDGGLTWGKQNNVTGVNERPTQVAFASDDRGALHFIQIVEKSNIDVFNQKGLVLQDWRWDGANWMLDLTKDFVVKGKEISYSMSASITTTGFLGVFMPVEYTDLAGETKDEVLTFSRFLENVVNEQPLAISVLPASNAGSGEEEILVLQATPTPDFSILYDDNLSTSPFQKNIVGLVVIGIGVIVTFILILWRRPAKSNK